RSKVLNDAGMAVSLNRPVFNRQAWNSPEIGIFGDDSAIAKRQRNRCNLDVNLLNHASGAAQKCKQSTEFLSSSHIERPNAIRNEPSVQAVEILGARGTELDPSVEFAQNTATID